MILASNKKLGIVVLLLIIIGLIALIYSQLSRVSKYIARFVPYAYEVKAADYLNIEGYLSMCKLKPAEQQALNTLVAKLYPQHEDEKATPISIVVADVKVPNAFTFLGGKVIVLKGLIDFAQTPEELAGVLAHEIEHVNNRHVLQSIIQSTILVSLVNLMSGNVSGLIVIDPSTLHQIINLSYSRKMEAEADEKALPRMLKAQVNPNGFKNFFERLKGVEPRLSAFLSTHPESKERAEWIKKNTPSSAVFKPVLSAKEFAELKKACK